jgi:hypothetical protein
MGRIRPLASALRARRPEERGRAGLLARLSPSGRLARAVPGRAHDVLSAVVTRVWHASGVATGNDSDGEVRRDAQNELQWVEADASGKEGASGAHRGRRLMVRRCKQLRAVKFNGGMGAPVTGGDGSVVL